ncbi:MAG: hypothetical protein AB7U29_18555 [Desulfobulbus sp.]
MDQRIKEHIENADWRDITLKLASYASKRARYVFKIQNNSSVLPMGFSVESVVQEAIRKLLDGTRKWNPDSVDLLGFLRGAVKSEIGHLMELIDNQMMDRRYVLDDIEDLGNAELSPEQALIEKEYNNNVDFAYQRLMEDAEADPEYEMIALCIMQDITKPADIAKETGIDINRVYYLKKIWRKDFEKILREVLAEAN